jgi:hypothetical protein
MLGELAVAVAGVIATPLISDEPFFLGAVVLGGWWLGGCVLRREAKQRCGYEIVDGNPRWRCALGAWTQCVFLPALFAAYALGGRQWAPDAFALIFGLFMFEDMATLNMPTVYFYHHCACLLGLAIALYSPAGFDCFFFSVVFLEIGSGLCNLYLMYPPRPWTARMYIISMTLSNILAVAGYVAFASHAEVPWGIRLFAGFETIVMVSFRQRECMLPETRKLGFRS